MDSSYDPFSAGPSTVATQTIEARDPVRDRLFPVEIWYPADSGKATPPLIAFSHYAGGHRRSATFLTTHLASHGYAVAALDHSEIVAPELAGRDGETPAERGARIEAVGASRVPDMIFLLDQLLGGVTGIGLDPDRIGLVGHSFGGWTALATPEVDRRVRSVVALAPGGASNPRPGILPLKLTFDWGRDVPTLYLAAEYDVPIPLAGVCELFDRTPASKRMFVLRRADHQHFADDVERQHEAVRAMAFPDEAAWIPAAMRPIAELCSGEQAHAFVRGLALAHLDASLRDHEAAARFFAGDVGAELATRGIEAVTSSGTDEFRGPGTSYLT
jgi:dienelactone hydrolase